MTTRSRSFKITLPGKDHRSFHSACSILRGRMGAKAPTIHTLMEHNLRNRDAAGLAEDYLAAIGWPFPKGLLRPVVGMRRLPRPPADVRRN